MSSNPTEVFLSQHLLNEINFLIKNRKNSIVTKIATFEKLGENFVKEKFFKEVMPLVTQNHTKHTDWIAWPRLDGVFTRDDMVKDY